MPSSPVQPPTRLACEVELDRPGRHVGRLGIIHSDGSAIEYGTVPVPITVLSHGEGPTVLLTAGTHGDEWEGQVLLHRLARELDLSAVQGRLIVMPALNSPAVLAAARVSPLDGGNLNRAYPGDRDGGPTAQIADFLTRYLLPHCDFAADLHSGGGSTEFLPCGFLTRMPHGRHTQAQAAAMEAFGMPHTVVYDEATEDRALDSACDQSDVVMVSTELSGGGTVNVTTLRQASQGLRRMLAHWGVLVDSTLPPSRGTAFLDINDPNSSVATMTHGLFEPTVGLGDDVQAGDVVGLVHPIEDLQAPAVELRSQASGIVYQRRVSPLVRPGNLVMSVGTPVARGDL